MDTPIKEIRRTTQESAIRRNVLVAEKPHLRATQTMIFRGITVILANDKHLLTATCHINTRSWLLHALT